MDAEGRPVGDRVANRTISERCDWHIPGECLLGHRGGKPWIEIPQDSRSDFFDQHDRLLEVVYNLGQTLDGVAGVIDDRHGISHLRQSAMKNNSHAQEEYTHRRRKGMDLSGLETSNGMAVRETRHIGRGLSPVVCKYATPDQP